MSIRSDKVNVSFEHALPRQFDLVIGADGLHSRVRQLAFGPAAQFEVNLGCVVAAFEVDGYRPRDEHVYVSYAAPGKQVARFALRDDKTMFLLISATQASVSATLQDVQEQKALLHAHFAHAGWECKNILAALDRLQDFYFEPVRQIRMPRWSQSRVALVGDAAFAPSPLAGQGAALAMVAAYVLAGELARKPNDHVRAFACYETRLRRFIATKQRSAERLAGFLVTHTHWGIVIRNQIRSCCKSHGSQAGPSARA
jgi:2-polyprenyl-6-methoxyphenol hydroxylase-like FAD-dependent oxidoreductase